MDDRLSADAKFPPQIRAQAVVIGSAPADFLSTEGEMVNDAPSPLTQLFIGSSNPRILKRTLLNLTDGRSASLAAT